MAKKKTAKKEAPATVDELPVEEYDATRYTPWVPGNMPVGGKSNSTEQLNDHPTEHNHSAEAISDIVDRFADLRLYVPAANSCGVDGNLKVDGQIIATGGGGKDAPAFQIGPDKALGMFGSINSQWIRFTTDGEYRFQISGTKATAYTDLQVNGQTLAQNGTKTAPAYSFTSDPDTGIYLYSAGITSITCDGKNIANFGLDGVAFPEGLATITGTAANLHIGENGQIRRITDVAKAPTNADLSRLETVIETLTARIEELEARLKPAATDA
jgi:hypothetical protein